MERGRQRHQCVYPAHDAWLGCAKGISWASLVFLMSLKCLLVYYILATFTELLLAKIQTFLT